MAYEEKAPSHSKPDYKPLNIIFTLTTARMALADSNLEMAKKKFEEVLDMDPENLEAKDFFQKYNVGVKSKKSRKQIVQDCKRNAEGVCIELPRTSSKVLTKKNEKDYVIEEVFIITSDGLLIGHFTTGKSRVVDADLMVSMLTAIQMFMVESFGDEELELQILHLNKFDMFFAQGKWVSIGVVVSGKKTYPVINQVKRFLIDVEETGKDVLPDWNGIMSEVKILKPMTLKLITGGYV